jgi:hypothetical protein
MKKLFNIRGTNGSGKSHVVHCLLKDHAHTELWDPSLASEKNPDGELIGLVVPSLNLRILGDYSTQCGGGDWYLAGRGGSKKSVDACEAATLQLWDNGSYNVIFECFMFSGTFGRWNEMGARLARDHGSELVVFAFLDTPKEVCAERIRQRRVRRAVSLGKDPSQLPEFDPKNCYDQHRQGLNIRRNMMNAGRTVVDIDHTRSYEHFMEIFHANQL